MQFASESMHLGIHMPQMYIFATSEFHIFWVDNEFSKIPLKNSTPFKWSLVLALLLSKGILYHPEECGFIEFSVMMELFYI